MSKTFLRKIKIFLRYSIFYLVLLLSSLNVSGQESLKSQDINNSIHFDFASAKFVGMYAINYERKLLQANYFKMNANAAVGAWYLTTISKWYYGKSISLSLNNLIGKGNDFFEIDLGIRYTAFSQKSDTDISPLFPIFNLGYRHQKASGKGLIFKTFIGFSGIGLGIGEAF